MAFKSHAQRLNALQKVKDGKLSQHQFDAYDKETPKSIPHRVGQPKPPVNVPVGPRSIPKPRSIAELRLLAKKNIR